MASDDKDTEPHEYTISFPKASCSEFKTFKYCPETRKVCLPDVLLLLGKEPFDYIARFAHDDMVDDVLSMFHWQMEWRSFTDKSRERQLNPVCSVCGVRPSKTQRCAACFKHRVQVIYCSAECRDQGWKEHRRVCMKKADPKTIAEIERAAGAVMRIKHDLSDK